MSAGLHLERRLHDLLQRAVDAVPDPQLVLEALEVDVGCAATYCVTQDPVDELDDRRVIDRRRQRCGGRLVVLVLQHFEIAFGLFDLVEQRLHRAVGRVIVTLDCVAERELAREHRDRCRTA